MLEQAKKNAIIVYRNKEEEFANLMVNLIVAYTEFEVARWDEKTWRNNKSSTSSAQKIIFIGNSESARKHIVGIEWKLNNEFKMKYGWLGNTCVVDADTFPSKLVKQFKDYYEEMATAYDNNAKDFKVLSKDLAAGTVSGDSVLLDPNWVFTAGIPAGIIGLVRNNSVLMRYQYEILVREFVFNGLKEFMEG